MPPFIKEKRTSWLPTILAHASGGGRGERPINAIRNHKIKKEYKKTEKIYYSTRLEPLLALDIHLWICYFSSIAGIFMPALISPKRGKRKEAAMREHRSFYAP